MEISDSEVNFLDTTVHLDPNGTLWADLYSKPTDSHNYLRFESSHPRHCMDGLPYSQFLRVRRICSREEDFVRHCETLRTHFIRRGYPTRLLDSAIDRAGNNHRKDLLTPHNETAKAIEEEEHRLFAIATVHRMQRAFRSPLEDNWDMLGSPATQGLYESPVVFGYRRSKNLRDMLVQAKVKLPHPPCDNPDAPLHECKFSRCRYCPKLDHSGTITCALDGRHYHTRQLSSCKSSRCHKHYVGETSQSLCKRMVAHFANISAEKESEAVGKHFSRARGHTGLDDVVLHILDFCQTPPDAIHCPHREKALRKWPFRLRSNFPFGMNKEDATPLAQ